MKKVDVFVVGCGNIGKALLDELNSNLTLKEAVRIVGFCNKKKYLLLTENSELLTWPQSLLENGLDYAESDFIAIIASLQRRCNEIILIDCSNSREFGKSYSMLMDSGIRIVTANKASLVESSCNYYHSYATNLLRFESCVGAGLPVIRLIASMISSGDEIVSVEAILSGTLSYLFNKFMPVGSHASAVPFLSLLAEAQVNGYTEPDPRDDLDGVDVARKAFILSQLLDVDIDSSSSSSSSSSNTSNPAPSNNDIVTSIACSLLVVPRPRERVTEELFSIDNNSIVQLGQSMDHARELCNQQGTLLRYVTTINIATNTVHTSLRPLSPSSPLLSAHNTDNICNVISKRFPGGITVIGAGAGAGSTIHGIVCDIIDLAKKPFNS